jgi:hypothetical protein
MKVAVVGLGYRMATVLKSFREIQPELAVVGLVDPAPAGLKQVGDAGLTVASRYDDVDNMIAAENPDLLMVGSPNCFHLDHIRSGLRHGIGDFVRNDFEVHSAASGEKLKSRRYEGVETDQYGADDQMAADIISHLNGDVPLPVGVIDALEAGLTAIKIDEARRDRKLVFMDSVWERFDAALAGKIAAQ